MQTKINFCFHVFIIYNGDLQIYALTIISIFHQKHIHTDVCCDFYSETVVSAFTNCLWCVNFSLFVREFLETGGNMNASVKYAELKYGLSA